MFQSAENHHRALVLITLLVGFSLSILAWRMALAGERQALADRFQLQVDDTREAIRDRFLAYEQVLRGGVALFATKPEVRREDWRRYVEQLQVERQYPGIQGIGFAVQLRHETLEEHVQAVRAEGFPEYRVHPLDADRAPTAIQFLEPFDRRNQRAFGYDMYSNPVRREAMARARDSGEPALSGRVTLLQETDIDRQAGTLLYLPLYHGATVPESLEARRAALRGWIYSPFRMKDLMQGILGGSLADMRLALYSGRTTAPEQLMFSAGQDSALEPPLFRRELQLMLAGQPWRMVLASGPAFGAGAFLPAHLVLVTGLLLSLLLGGLIARLTRARRHALHLAGDMSEALRKNEMRRAAILRFAPFAIITTDSRGLIRSLNPAAERLLGYREDEAAGRLSLDEFHDPDELRVRTDQPHGLAVGIEALFARARRGEPEESEWSYVRKDGRRIPVHVAINAMRHADGRLDGFLAMAYDIEERLRTQACIQHMAHHDALTDLPNRVLLQDRLEQAMRQARRDGRLVAVLMLDLDHFKRINDSLGHHVGDDLLLRVAERISGVLRRVDTVARTGGDEFVVVLPGIRDSADVNRVVEQLLETLSQPMPVERHEMIVTPSIGICLFPRDGEDVRALLKHADTAMYQAKDAGRGGYKYFQPQMLHHNERRLETESALRKALQTDELSLAFQPQIDLRSGLLTGCEALLRWRHPVLGDVPPDQFVPLAEEMGLIQPIGDWVLREACEQTMRLRESLNLPLNVAVNISPRQFLRRDLVPMLHGVLRDTGLPPDSLEIELTEGVLIQNPEQAVSFLQQIRALGVRVAIDDFGTGYSSLSYLTRFPIDKLKIDQSFIRDLSVDASDAAIISAIIVMAHTLRLSVTAEGVETPQQLAFLHDRDCDSAQGYYFGTPMSPKAFSQSAAVLQPGLTGGLLQMQDSAGPH